jgi:excisionase family DNA binding protein
MRREESWENLPEVSLDDLLTIQEVAAKLKVKERTIREWIAQRRIAFTRIGRRIYIPGQVVRDILRRNLRPALRRPPSNALREQGGDEEKKRGEGR